MGLFSRKGRDEPAEESFEPEAVAPEGDDEIPEGTTSVRLTAEQRADVQRLIGEVEASGVDIDDLASIEAAFDRALALHEATPSGSGQQDKVVQLIGVGIGEHLVRHGRFDWMQITDAFGTDVGVVARRRDVSVVPGNIAAARWMARKTGWVQDVVAHLVRVGQG